MLSLLYTGSVVSHCRSNSAYVRVKRAGNVYGMSWLPGTTSSDGPSAQQEAGGRVVLLRCASVAEVAAYDHELRHKPVDEWAQRQFCGRSLRRADVEIRNVQDACKHRRSRLYTRIVTDESTEIFDDLYLGLRAGGAVRKQRRGEPLTTEEQEALGRWQRLSTWRKSVAIGSFALGTFGLGVALGGLVFGRWRKAA
jgi:hypothetical protein